MSSVRSTGGFYAFEIWFMCVLNVVYVRSKCGSCAFKMWLLYVQNVVFIRSKVDFCVFCKYVFPVVRVFVISVYSLDFYVKWKGWTH